jgi:hypothetical protein
MAVGIVGKLMTVLLPIPRRVYVPVWSFLVMAAGIYMFGCPAAQAGTLRTQQVQLQKGWNSVFLEVFPIASAPEVVFANAPVSIVAAYFPPPSSVAYITDPSRTNWKKEGWGVWYAPGRDDAFLSNLFSVDGNRAYLIYAQRDFTWNVEGNVQVEKLNWRADSFNLAGFSVDEVSPPTFGKFFAGSKAHTQPRIYRLINDRWTKVAAPDATLMKSGESCWVYCAGASDWQGPLAVTLPFRTGLAFGNAGSDQLKISLANNSTDPTVVKTECNDGGLPLSYVLRNLAQDRINPLFLDLPSSYSMPVMEAGAQRALTLQVRRERMGQGFQSSLMKISTDNGVRIWVPLAAQREDLGQ